MRAWIEEPPKPLAERHIVVAGFMGGRHEEIGRSLAKVLGRDTLDTFQDQKTQAIWTIDPDLASLLEISAAVPLCDLPPRVALMRTLPYCRLRAHQLFTMLNPVRIYVDTPREVCMQRIERGEWLHDDNKKMARAIRDLGEYNEHTRIAMYHSDFVIATDDKPGTSSAAAEMATRLLLEQLTGGPPSAS